MDYTSKPHYTFSITIARNGEQTLCGTARDGSQRYFSSKYEPMREARRKVDCCQDVSVAGYVLLGVALGYELQALVAVLRPGQNILVIEKSPAIFDLFKKMPFFQKLYDDARVTFCVGHEDAMLQPVLAEYGGRSQVFVETAVSKYVSPDFYMAVKERLSSSAARCTMHALLLVGKGVATPYILTDIATTLRAFGHTVSFAPLQDVAPERDQITGDYDFIFSLDYAGFEKEWVQQLPGLRVTWFVDNPFYFINQPDPDVLVFTWDSSYVKELRAGGFRGVHPLRLATNPEFFKPCPVQQKYKTDVSFVGSVAQTLFGSAEEQALLCKGLTMEILKASTDRVYARFLSGRPAQIDRLLSEIGAPLSLEATRKLSLYHDYVVGNRLRCDVVKGLANFDHRVYGNEGMRSAAVRDDVYGGFVDYHAELPALYSASKININVTRPQLVTTVNQRIYDVSGCGSFFLSDWREDIAHFFPDVVDAVCYRSIDELKDKIRYFLEHEKERNEIAAYTQAVVIKEHTYTRRVREMLEIVELHM